VIPGSKLGFILTCRILSFLSHGLRGSGRSLPVVRHPELNTANRTQIDFCKHRLQIPVEKRNFHVLSLDTGPGLRLSPVKLVLRGSGAAYIGTVSILFLHFFFGTEHELPCCPFSLGICIECTCVVDFIRLVIYTRLRFWI
jgi:hypothetical protein